MAVSAATVAAFLHLGPIPAIFAGLAAGAVLGAVNGTLVARVGIQPIVATLGMLVAARGIALLIAEGRLTEIFDPFFGSLTRCDPDFLPGRRRGAAAIRGGHPVRRPPDAAHRSCHRIRRRQDHLRTHLLATGGNPTAARLAGVPVMRTLITVYVLSAVLAATAGIIQTARTSAADPSFLGNLIELSAISAVVVGGTPFSGGRVRIMGTLAGALFMQLIETTLIRNNLSDSVARMVAAVLTILSAVFVQREREDG